MKRVINGKTYSKVLGIKQGSLLTAGKDGDIEEYKADPTDAGKVLTVGEDGGVAPAEGGGGDKLYAHNIKYQTANYPYLSFSASIINGSSTPFTAATLQDYIVTNFKWSTSPSVKRGMPCSGIYHENASSNCVFFDAISAHPTQENKYALTGGFLTILSNALSLTTGETLINMSTIGTIIDTVVAL